MGTRSLAKNSCGKENGGLGKSSLCFSSSLTWWSDLTLEVHFISLVLNFMLCTVPWSCPSFALLLSPPLFCSFTRLLTEHPV